MVLGKNLRTDGRRSAYCSTTTVALLVALCLIGVWFLTSTTIVPVDLAATGSTSDVTREVSQNDNVVEDKQKEINLSDDQSEKSQEEANEKPEEIPVIETEERKDEADDATQGQSDSEGNKDDVKDNINPEKSEPKENVNENPQTDDDDSGGEFTQDKKDQVEIDPKVEETESKEVEHGDGETKNEEEGASEMLVDPAQAELLNETRAINGSWATQAMESKKEKETKKSSDIKLAEYNWKLCNASTGHDYIPCLDNTKAKIRNTGHYEHRERHCPEEGPICLVSCPEGYKQSIKWPESRNKIWYANVPHTKLAAVKGHQNWVKVTGEYLTFPGGGTQFVNGALHYIDFIQENFPDIAWGKKTRVVLDVGCGVASFGGFLFERDVITMSFAPKDEHEAQVQFALERGIPAISAVMGTKRLPFPSRVFDVVHCARCRVPWHIEGGMLLLELNRMLRPGGYFVWSATPVYRNNPEDNAIWRAMKELTNSMCWEMVSKIKDSVNKVGVAIFKKPSSNECYENRKVNKPPLCKDSDDPNASWNVLLEACMHKAPIDPVIRGSQWPELWPKRLETPPYWLNGSQIGLYGQVLPVEFKVDYNHWKRVVGKSYLSGLGINWSNVRNVMDMRAIYGGFAAALKEINVWVLNVVPIDSADTLPIIYERGLFGIYHDWCESFSTYPRTYDLLHADHLFSLVKSRCKLLSVMAEVDRILRPEGTIVVRDDVDTISELEQIARSLHWEIHMTYSKEKEGLISMQKMIWHPEEIEAVMY